MTTWTLTPAYGRDYKSKADVLAAFDANKDFIDASWSGSGKPINKEQIPMGAHVNIRYAQLRKVAVLVNLPSREYVAKGNR